MRILKGLLEGSGIFYRDADQSPPQYKAIQIKTTKFVRAVQFRFL